jgi:hypothetical protein
MPKIRYITRAFAAGSLALIHHANTIIAEYAAQGYSLTLRQLYYQFVSRDLIPNRVSEYKRLGSIVNDGRLAGLIDWDAIEDRTPEPSPLERLVGARRDRPRLRRAIPARPLEHATVLRRGLDRERGPRRRLSTGV